VQELAVLAAIVAAVMVATTFAFRWIGPVLRIVELQLAQLSAVIILFVMAFVSAEVAMRYLFNSPIPGHLEGSELLMPIIVFPAVSYTQATRGHVGMDLVLDALPDRSRRFAVMAGLLASIFICSVLAFFGYKNAIQLWRYDDVTMSPPYFPTWPAAAAIPVGYALISLRMFIQFLNLLQPDRFPDDPPTHAGLHAGD
jgi:TRAP-type C4-dicarboxylate transport system permease small subunit